LLRERRDRDRNVLQVLSRFCAVTMMASRVVASSSVAGVGASCAETEATAISESAAATVEASKARAGFAAVMVGFPSLVVTPTRSPAAL